jgi:hypothetical protein
MLENNIKIILKQEGCADVDWMQLTRDGCLIAGYSESALVIFCYTKVRKCMSS